LERKRHCKTCGRELEFTEWNSIGVYIAPSYSNNWSGGSGADVYCDQCYKDVTGESIKDAPKSNKKGNMDILKNNRATCGCVAVSNLIPGQQTQILVEIASPPSTKTIMIKNQEYILQQYSAKDETGEIVLLFWDIPNQYLTLGKLYKIKGKVKLFQGSSRKYFSIGIPK
jgi:hypothetical protein